MESNEDIAAPDTEDVETIEMPVAAPTIALEQPAAPSDEMVDAEAITDAETTILDSVGAADTSDTSDISSEDTIQFAAQKPNVARVAPVDDDVSLADTMVETPAVLMPVVRAVQGPPPSSAETSTRPQTIRSRIAQIPWLRYPEFWLVVALAAFLRLWGIDLTEVLSNQVQQLLLARGAWLHGALPATGVATSVGALSPPLTVYAAAPFMVFGKDPLLATIAIALWNLLGVIICYIFANRYFGRVVAASGALLFATSGMAVYYSRSVWAPNYLPPVLILCMLMLFLGCISGRRGWFAPHVALLIMAIQILPAAALLIPVSVLGFLLAPRKAWPSRREWALTIGLVALLLAPTLLWESLTSFHDIRVIGDNLFNNGGAFNLDAFRLLAAMLGAPNPGELGANSLYAQTGSWAGIVNAAVIVCFVAGFAVLTVRLGRVGLYVWREGIASATDRQSRVRSGSVAIWHGLRAEPVWRAHLLLWLWIVLPLLLLLWHTSALARYDLLVLYPAAFIVGGFAFQAAFRAAEKWVPRAAVARQVAPAIILTALTVLVLAQAFQSALYPAALASGSYNAFASAASDPGRGYPLAELKQLDTALGALQAEQHARSIFVSLPTTDLYRDPIEYMTLAEHPDRVGFTASCLVLPTPDEGPALMVATQPAGPANSLLSSLPMLKPVANLAMAGSAAIAVYQLSGKLPPLIGEQAMSPITFADAAGNGLRLDAMAMQPDGQIRLRWTVLGSAATSQGAPWYRIAPSVRLASGNATALPATDCQPTRWRAGETVFTWISGKGAAMAQTLLLQVSGGARTDGYTLRSAGPLQLLASQTDSAPLTPLRPSPGTTGTVGADGSVAIPLSATP
ncbi:MAG TPA: glycosyltransferase family 39 protein [Ktedonobacterales bacterium]|nr:glycosyltransferase family 39 protein [Ktedonobacterales bacterium]